MALSITVTDSTGAIIVGDGTNNRAIPKFKCSVKAEGDNVVVRDGEEIALYYPYTAFASPTGASANAIVALIEAFLDTAGTPVTISAALPAGENHIGSAGGDTLTATATQVTNASAYEAGDCVGGKITLTNAMRVSGGSGVLNTIHIIDKANQKAALEILIFDADPTAATITDDTAFAYSTDITKQIARIPVVAGDYTTINSIATVSLGGLSKIVKANGSRHLYAAVVTSGTPTYTSTSDIIVTFGILQD